MVRIMLFVGGVVSFVVGCLIFLVGTGAILGCAGGLVALFLGVMICLLGVGAIINFIASRSEFNELNVQDVVDLMKKNGKWTAS